jgi:hypothetical protein
VHRKSILGQAAKPERDPAALGLIDALDDLADRSAIGGITGKDNPVGRKVVRSPKYGPRRPRLSVHSHRDYCVVADTDSKPGFWTRLISLAPARAGKPRLSKKTSSFLFMEKTSKVDEEGFW